MINEASTVWCMRLKKCVLLQSTYSYSSNSKLSKFIFVYTYRCDFTQDSIHGTNKELAASYDQNKFYKNVRIKFQGELGLDGFDRFK